MSDKLTDDGLFSDSQVVTLLDYLDLHGEPVHVGPDRVVFADKTGNELADWAEILGMSRGELSEQMHKLAREVYARAEATGDGDPWSVADPVVFDADTFRQDDFEAIALLIRRGCSPAEAIDWFATTNHNWSQTDWGEWRDRGQQAISHNVTAAKEHLD